MSPFRIIVALIVLSLVFNVEVAMVIFAFGIISFLCIIVLMKLYDMLKGWIATLLALAIGSLIVGPELISGIWLVFLFITSSVCILYIVSGAFVFWRRSGRDY